MSLAFAPTEAQKQVGNYKKDHISVHGLPITIENRQGSMRRGVGGDGKPWSVRMPAHYGYFKKSEGADGDHVDCYVGPHIKAPRVFVIDQKDADTGEFDEHKVMLCFGSKEQALAFYRRGFSDGKGQDRIGNVKTMTVDEFKDWLKNGDTTKAIKRAAGGRIGYAEGGALPDAPWATPSPKAETLPDAPWAPAKPKDEPTGLLSRLASPITDIPHEIYRSTADALNEVNTHLNPWSEGFQKATAGKTQGPLGNLGWTDPGSFLGTGKGLLAAASVPFSPVAGVARSVLGHPISAAMPTVTPERQEQMRKAGVSEDMIPGTSIAENYERARGYVDTAMMGMGPRGATPRGIVVPTPVPPRPAPGPLGVALSEGQESGALPLIQKEQAALRGQLGEAAQARAREFADQQRAQVETATERVQQGFDPFNQVIAETPQEAGQVVSDAMRTAAAQRKAGVTQAYDYAKSLPGEIHADAFHDIGQTIKTDLSARPDPIIIDDKLTPFASHAIRDVEDRIAKLQIQNRADPLGQPDPASIIGVDLRGVDQMRKRLVAFRRDAYGSGNGADGRAASGVIDAFDKRIDAAINGGLFNGDPMAVQAWNDARAAHADYKGTFSAGKNDPTGRVVEKILGKQNNPAAIPNDVADFMYGGSGVNPSSLNVNVAKRVRTILGDQSPEWSAVKQGLFARIVDPGPGVTDWGPGKIAQRVNKFLNVDGLELSKEVFSPQERALIQQYGQLQRTLEVPQAGANWSGTGTAVAPILKKISAGVAAIVGGFIGHVVAPGLHGAGEGIGAMTAAKVTKTVGEMRTMRQISQQMPLVAEQTRAWQRAVVAANRSNNSLPTQRSLAVATANLTGTLTKMGLDPSKVLGSVQGGSPASADENPKP